jgi:hypothetical protein
MPLLQAERAERNVTQTDSLRSATGGGLFPTKSVFYFTTYKVWFWVELSAIFTTVLCVWIVSSNRSWRGPSLFIIPIPTGVAKLAEHRSRIRQFSLVLDPRRDVNCMGQVSTQHIYYRVSLIFCSVSWVERAMRGTRATLCPRLL